MWVLVMHNHHWNGDTEINLRKTERTTDREAACACFVHDECLHKWSLVQSSQVYTLDVLDRQQRVYFVSFRKRRQSPQLTVSTL